MNSPLVYILLLNYNSFEDAKECTLSIKDKVHYDNYRILLLDNLSTDASAKELEDFCEGREDVSFLEVGSNYGYAHGNNVGLRIALQQGAAYAIIMNPDARAHNDFVTKIVERFEIDKTAALVGPGCYKETGTDVLDACGHTIGKLTAYTQNMIHPGTKRSDVKEDWLSCDYVTGMCLGVRLSVIETIGYLPENYFLFYEETEWCKKARDAGYKVLLDLTAMVYHKGSVSVDQISGGEINLHKYYLHRNRVVYQKRNQKGIIYVLFVLYYGAEILYERLKGHYTKESTMGWRDGIRGKDRLGHINKELL